LGFKRRIVHQPDFQIGQKEPETGQKTRLRPLKPIYLGIRTEERISKQRNVCIQLAR